MLFINLKKKNIIQLRGEEILCNTEYGIPMRVDVLSEVCLNEIYSEVRMAHICPTHFQLRLVRNKKCLIAIAFHFAFEYVIRRVQKNEGCLEIEWYTSAAGLC